MAQAKATKWEILNFIESEEIISAYDLMERFSYTYSYACKKLSLLKKQGLVRDMGNTPSTYRGQWCLTSKGYERLYYLSKKLGVLTQRERKVWQARFQEERGKPYKESRIWRLDENALGPRLVKEGEYGVTLEEVMEAIKIDREQLLYGALSRWDGGSIPKDEILKDLLNLMTRMKVEGTSWDEISNEVETRFGVKFDAESLEFLFGLYRDAVRKRMKAR